MTIYGPDVTPGDTYFALHTRVSPSGEIQWISGVHEDTWMKYKRLAHIEVEEGRVEGTSTGRTPWIAELWQRVASIGRKRKGSRILGFGEHGVELLALPTSKRGPSSSSSSILTRLTPSDQIQSVVDASLAEERQRVQEREEALQAEIRRLKEVSEANSRIYVGLDFFNMLQQGDYNPDANI